MKIDCISDLHGEEPKLSGGDLLIIAGDLTASNEEHQYERLFSWLEELAEKYEKIVVIAGNHDGLIQNGKWKAWPLGVTYLEDSICEFGGFKIYGSPWTPVFGNWHFMKPRGEMIRKVWDRIPIDTDILVTHGPPIGVLDTKDKAKAWMKPLGCYELRQAIERIRPKLHVFGHIHGGYGQTVLKHEIGETICVNASVLDEEYEHVNEPISVYLTLEVENALNPETIDGDYREAYQVWHHKFEKNRDAIDSCFKETAFVPFEPLYDFKTTPKNYNKLINGLINYKANNDAE